MPTDSAHAQAVGRRLYEARQELGLTQKQAADAAGVTVTAWSSWERGRKLSRSGAIREKVARALGRKSREAIEALYAPPTSSRRTSP